jgi:hypothetical protein
MTRTPVPLLAAALLATVLTAIPRPAAAVWPHDPTVNVPLCTATGNQTNPAIVSDGAGGAIVTWSDARSGTNDIYSQRVSASGVALWTANGVAICTATGSQETPTIVADGAGGTIVTWVDYRGGATSDIYAQRISAAGVAQWTNNGMPLCNTTGNQLAPTIISDGAGGAIVTWVDYRGGATSDIYAQRISAAGGTQWTVNGVALCNVTSDQNSPTIVSDGAGGAIVTWMDFRSTTNYDIYAQRIASTGALQWTAGGVAVCIAINDQSTPSIVSDGAGGAIITWSDARGADNDIYAQRIHTGGGALWASNGVALCNATGYQYGPTSVADNAGWTIVTWYDGRNGLNDIYAQEISPAGAVQWTANGVALCGATGEQKYPTIVADGVGGAIATWYDVRSGSNLDVYAQRISSAGTVNWVANGVALCNATGYQHNPMIVADGAGGAIVAWYDYRNGSTADIYAQRVDEWGYLGAEPAIASVRDIPNDQGGLVKVSWNASPLDVDPLFRSIDSYLLFRSAPPNLVAQAVRSGAVPTQDPSEAAGQPGRLLATPLGALTYYWEYVGTQEAYHLPTYSMVAPTTGDSISGSNPRTAFLVQAWVVGGDKWWSSAADSGYSVDNLAPLTPAPFTGQYAAGAATLHWAANAAPDLGEYRLYRGSSAAFVPGPANLVTAQPDTGYVDAAGTAFYYKLCAVDVHGNVSGFSTLLPSGTVDVAGVALPRAAFLATPAPNPARGATTLRFGLPRAAAVELALYDQQGRRVRSLLAGTQPAGERTIAWNGCDESGRALPAGLYFVRLATEGRTFVSRLAVIR